MSDPATPRRRLTAQLLAGPPARDPVDVARRLLAIQAQDGRSARLAVRARSRGVSAAEIDRALTEDRSLVITWLQRGTLHLVASEDYHWLHALTTPPLLTPVSRRLAQEGVDPAMTERALALIERAVGADGPLTRMQLRERLERAGVTVAGQALIHILFRAAVEGLVVRGPMVGNQHAYVLARDWLGPMAAAPRGSRGSRGSRDAALAELARRYLAGHGPASDRDLARWAGLPLRDARAGLGAIARELLEEPGGLVDLRARGRMAPLPPPRLLGGWEPLLVGWTARAHVLGGDDAAVVSGGLFRNFALVDGRGVATWRWEGRAVRLEPYAPISGADIRALEADGEAMVRFLGR